VEANMQRKVGSILLCAFIFSAIFVIEVNNDANAQVTEEWVRIYNGPGDYNDQAVAIALDPSGNIYVTGTINDDVTGLDYGTIKYDPSGNELWIAKYNGPGNNNDEARDIAVGPSGYIYVTGHSVSNQTSYDYATIKYDSNGNQIWVARYNGPGNGYDDAFDLTLDSSENVYITGRSYFNSGTQCATVKYDSNGNELWSATFDSPGNYVDDGHAVAVDLVGNVYVTGWTSGYGTKYDIITIKYDAFGNEIWVSRYNGPGNDWDRGCDVAVTPSGNAIVTGYRRDIGPNNYDYITIAYDSLGNEIWVAIYNGPGNDTDQAMDMALDSSGNIYVTGRSIGNGSGYDLATIKYDPFGNEDWVVRYNSPNNLSEEAWALDLDSSGNVYVTGRVWEMSTSWDYITVAYDNSGKELWAARYNGPGNGPDWARDICVDSSYNVYVTGWVEGIEFDYATIKYSQDLQIQTPIAEAGLDQMVNEGEIVQFNGSLSMGAPITDQWQSKTEMPTPRQGFGVGVVNNKIYAIGGVFGNYLGTYFNINEEYDALNDSWTTKSPMPTPRWEPGAAVVDGKIYVIGGMSYNSSSGFSYYNVNEVYDPDLDTWTTKAPMPTPRYGLTLSVVDGKIYAIGGTSKYGYTSGLLTINEEYDPITDNWITKAPMPTPRFEMAAAVVSGKIYVVGGGQHSENDVGYDANEVYILSNDSWITRTPIPTARRGLAAGVINKRIYAVGGWDYTGNLDKNEEYNPVNDRWVEKAPMPTSRYGLGVGVVNDSLYAIGGFFKPQTGVNEEYHIVYSSITSYEWDFDANIDSDGDGNLTNDIDATGPTPTHIYGDDGIYTVTLKVTDNQSLSDTDTCIVIVNNLAPTIKPIGPFMVDEDFPFPFNGNATDPGSDDLTFIWSWGDWTSDTTTVYYNEGIGSDPYPSPWGTFPFFVNETVQHAYKNYGVYTLNLKVEDDDGGVALYKTNVTVIGLPPPTLHINTSPDGKDTILYWDPPPAQGIDHYLIYRSTSQIGFDFNNVWKNTSIDKEPGEPNPIPLRTMWNDTNAAFPGNVSNYEEQYYYVIRAVNIFGKKSYSSRTVGKWTKTYLQGISTFSLPFQPLQNLTIDQCLMDMNARYIKWMHPGLHKWMKHGDGAINDSLMKVGEGYEVRFDIHTNYTFTGMPGAMIMYDDNTLFLGFDYASEAINLTVVIDSNGDVNLTWQEAATMGAGDWYEVYYSNTRDGFFGTFNVNYFSVCPPVNFGNNTVTHSGALANDPGTRLYYIVVPFNTNSVRGSSTYSIGIWTEEYLDQYDTIGIPLKFNKNKTADWYCDNIPYTVGINYYDVNENRWCWHTTRMPEEAYDPILVMVEGYQISTSNGTKYTFIGV
jgi:hypothetical protein